MNKYLLIYHKEDNDGVVSAALFYNYLEDKLKIHKNLESAIDFGYGIRIIKQDILEVIIGFIPKHGLTSSAV